MEKNTFLVCGQAGAAPAPSDCSDSEYKKNHKSECCPGTPKSDTDCWVGSLTITFESHDSYVGYGSCRESIVDDCDGMHRSCIVGQGCSRDEYTDNSGHGDECGENRYEYDCIADKNGW